MPNGPDTSGYDPIVGVQPSNPTDLMTFSMLKRPGPSGAPGPPAYWPRIPFKIAITSFCFTKWDGSGWVPITGPDSDMPFIVDSDLVGTGGMVAGNKQFVIPLEPNTQYSGTFPACIEVEFDTTGPDAQAVNHMARTVRFT